MKRQNSSSSLMLLGEADLDSSDDVFDPPAWRPGRYLQFADISLEDEPSVRPVSLYAERTIPSLGASSVESSSKQNASSSSYIVQMDSSQLSPRHLRLSRGTTLVVTSCVFVALTALTLLTFVL